MDRAERQRRVQEIRKRNPDASLRDIAKEVGASHSTVQRDLAPELRDRYHDASKEHRRTLGHRVGQVEDQLRGLAHLLGVSDERLAEATAQAKDRRQRELEALEAGAAELEGRRRSAAKGREGQRRQGGG